MNGNTQVNATSAIFERWSIPNHKMNTGRNATLGEGKLKAMSGSSSHRTARMRAIRKPTKMPAVMAMRKADGGSIEADRQRLDEFSGLCQRHELRDHRRERRQKDRTHPSESRNRFP